MELRAGFERLSRLCTHSSVEDEIRGVFDTLGWSLLNHAIAGAPPGSVRRITRITRPYRARMTPEHLRIDDLLRKHEESLQTPAEVV
ncbi:hypothetical protein [Streptomyces sp. NPDC002994]|uniref:hypothetical protein n=1 Tax=Streptomyces sp. NPDC002994 TaxID=3154441 RepID=UPI0033B21A42